MAATVGGVVGLAGLGVVGSALYLKTESGNEWLRSKLESLASNAAGDGDVHIARLQTNLWSHWRVEGLDVVDANGRTLTHVGRVAIDMNPLGLLRRQLDRPVVRLTDVTVDVTRLEDGTLDLSNLFSSGNAQPKQQSDQPSNGSPIGLKEADVRIEGLSVAYRAQGEDLPVFELGGGAVSATVSGSHTTWVIEDLDLGGVLVNPGPAVVRAQGDLWISGGTAGLQGVEVSLPGTHVVAHGLAGSERMDLTARVDSLDLKRLETLFGEPGVQGVFRGDLRLAGPMEAVQVTGALDGGPAGRLGSNLWLNLDSPSIAYRGGLTFDRFQVDAVYPDAGGPVILNGRADVDGHGTSWPDDLTIAGELSGGPQDLMGNRVDDWDVRFLLTGGRIQLEPSEIHGIVGDLVAEGSIDVYAGPMDLHVGGLLQPDRLAALGAEGFRTPGRLDARILGSTKTISTAGLDVTGNVAYDDFVYGSDVRFHGMTADFRAHTLGSAVRGVAHVRTGSGVAYGLALASTDSRNVRFDVAQDKTTHVTGTTTGRALRYGDLMSSEGMKAGWDLHMSSSGRMRTVADVALAPYDLLGFPGTGGGARVVMDGDQLAFETDLRDGDRPAWRLVGTYAMRTGRVDFAQMELSPTPRQSWTAVPGAHLTVSDGGVEDANLELTSSLGAVVLTGDLGTQGQLDGRIVTRGFQLDTLAELFPDAYGGLSGVADLDVALSGSAHAARVEGTMNVQRLWVDGVTRWLDVTGRFEGERDTVELDVAIGSAGEPLADVRGTVPVKLDLAAPGLLPENDVDVQIALRPGSLARIERVAPQVGELPAGNLSGVLEAKGPMRDPALRLAGVAELPVAGWDHPGRLEFDMRRTGDDATFRLDARDGVTALGTVTGGAKTRIGEVIAWATGATKAEPDLQDWSLYADDMDVQIALLGLPVQGMLSAAGQTLDARGSLVGGFSVQGSPWAPVVEGGVNWLDPAIGNEELAGAYLSVVPNGAGYDVTSNVAFIEGGGLDVEGKVPIEPDLRKDTNEWVTGDIDVHIGGAGVPVALISGFNPDITEAEGIMKVEGTLTGNPLDPNPEMTVALDGGAFSYQPLGIRLNDVSFRFDGEDRRFRVSKFVAHPEPIQRGVRLDELGEGGDRPTIRAAGSVQVAGGAPDAVGINVKLENGAWLSATPDQLLRLDGTVVVSGTYPDLVATGDLELDRGRVTLDAASFAQAGPLTPDPRLVIDRPRVEEPVAEVADAGPTLWDSLKADVNVDLQRNMELNWSLPFVEDYGSLVASIGTMDLSSRLGGSTRVTFENGEPSAVGQIELIEGRVKVLRSNFDLERGTITFAGGDPTEPALDIDAKMTVSSGSVDMKVTGTPSSPDVALSSDTWADEATLLTVVLTGQAPEDLTAQEGSGASTEALAALALTSALSGASLGNISIDANGVRVGVPLTQRVYAETIVLREPAFDENQFTVQLEWNALPQVVLDLAVGEAQRWGDIYYEVRF